MIKRTKTFTFGFVPFRGGLDGKNAELYPRPEQIWIFDRLFRWCACGLFSAHEKRHQVPLFMSLVLWVLSYCVRHCKPVYNAGSYHLCLRRSLAFMPDCAIMIALWMIKNNLPG